jgi:CO dehydrogenase nickel-insertion accessory protein CooC1
LLKNLHNSNVSNEIKKQIRIRIFVVLNRVNSEKSNKKTSSLTSMYSDKVGKILDNYKE